jgi:glycosyltransferase involved in cell wall biosynthesis
MFSSPAVQSTVSSSRDSNSGNLPAARLARRHVHVPTPGDHYSPATGSATMSLIHEIAVRHAAAGGETQIIVGKNTRHDYAAGQCVEVNFHRTIDKGQKFFDALMARGGFSRRIENEIYRPALGAIEPGFDGVIFLHNCPGVVAAFKERFPSARICLYAVNALFRTYSLAEVRRVIAAVDRMICCSRFIANDVRERLGVVSEKIVVVHNGVNVENFRPAAMPASAPMPATEDQPPRILFMGRVIPDKGPDLLIQAALKLHEQKKHFKLRIVGSAGYRAGNALTPYERQLRSLARPIADRVEFQASVDRGQLLREYQEAAIFCAPVRWDDPFPLTVLEAMACGVPTVAGRRGGIPEIGDSILYFKPRDVEQLAGQIARLLDDSQFRARCAARCRSRAEDFSWDLQYNKLVAAAE